MQTALIHIFIIKFILDSIQQMAVNPNKSHENFTTETRNRLYKTNTGQEHYKLEHFSLRFISYFKCIIILSMKMAIIQLTLHTVALRHVLWLYLKTKYKNCSFVCRTEAHLSWYTWELSIIRALFITALHPWSSDSVQKRLIWMNLEYKMKTLQMNNQAH